MERTGKGKQRVTMNDVAEMADVSPATVSFVFSGNGRVSEDTARRVLEAADELRYRPPRHRARSAVERDYQVAVGRGTHDLGPVIDMDEEIEFLRLEFDQRRQEGCNVDALEDAVKAMVEGEPSLQDVQALYRRLEKTIPRSDFPYIEPNEWEEIARGFTPLPEHKSFFTSDGLYDRIYGAWLGRCVGCILGRAVENLESEENSYQTVETYLRLGNAYPLTDYVPEILPYSGIVEHPIRPKDSLRGNIQFVPRDDDLDFTILNLMTQERYGSSVTAAQFAHMWLSRIPYNYVYTAEHAVYRNLVNKYGPPDSALYRNPFREYIGAQIRADMFGYTAPGQPRLAAERAYQDARLSHVKNGIYGEMLVAAMVAAAFDAPDVESIIAAGLSVIPPRSRMAEAVRLVVDAVQRQGLDWYEGIAFVNQRYAEYHWVHVLPNVAIVIHALLQGQGDFEKSITIAAMSGKDTDCNAATVGSITGVFNGAALLPGKWIAPLNNRIQSAVTHHSDSAISELAQRTLRLAVNFLTASMGLEG
jgi:ADP-ribosylglycohydrolase